MGQLYYCQRVRLLANLIINPHGQHQNQERRSPQPIIRPLSLSDLDSRSTKKEDPIESWNPRGHPETNFCRKAAGGWATTLKIRRKGRRQDSVVGEIAWRLIWS